ncbi:hybrid sensor histidine kinase/response regulator transcription factor [Emticicia sp. 17c]|uniref:hybrid sensor histidine kinase/response regulator transcription factor n=1 Tax=Emticicia sp. 17c TaxID=3127704 RepID=UPI00301D42A3
MVKRILLLQLLCITCLAQQNLWHTIGIADGLSQSMVYDLMLDHEGFMWVATKDGLNRYDGYNFKVFTNNPYQEYSISGNTCTSILEDSKGRIWVSTEKDGLNLFDSRSQRFYHANPPLSSQESSFIITYIKEDIKGNIWVITDNPDKTFMITHEGYPERSDFSEWLLKADISTKNNTYFKFDYRSANVPSMKEFAGVNNFPDTFSKDYFFLEDRQHRYWVVDRQTVRCYVGKKEIKSISFPFWGIGMINQFDDGSLAISNQKYIWIFKPDELLKQDKLTPENAFASTPDLVKSIKQLVKDKYGNIWAGTYGYGLLMLNKNVKQFHSILQSYSPSHIYEDHNGKLFIHGNYRPTYHFYEIDPLKNTASQIPVKLEGESYIQDALIQDNKKGYYLVHHTNKNHFFSHYSHDWKLQKHFDITAYSAPASISHKMIADKNGFVWLGVQHGNLLRFNPETEQFQLFSYQSVFPKNNALTETFALYEDSNSVFWIGTQKGLVKAENLSSQPRYTLYKNSKTDEKSLSNDFVSAVVNDPYNPQRYLWVSTKGGGLERLDKNTGTFEHFTEKQGLPNKVVYGILTDNNRNLWLSTNRGLSRFNPKTMIFANFDKSDGIQDDEFNTNAYFRGPSGHLFFGGINGVTIVNTTPTNTTKQLPAMKMIGLKINNLSVNVTDNQNIIEKPIEYLDKLEVAHDQNQLSLEFGLMDFTNPAKNRYRYQLEGIDNDWVEAGTNHFANYAQLPSGKYKFKVVGTVDGEVWSKPIGINIKINPPFYRSWWAYLIYLSVFMYIAYRLYISQLNRVRLQEQLFYQNKETERLAELDSLKTRFFANISHEFRTPLTLLAGPLADFSKKYPNERMFDVMQRNMNRLQTLINQILDLSKLEAGKMKPQIQEGNIAAFVKNLKASFESLALNKNIQFEYNKDQASHTAFFDADKLEKIISNLLSNAFKFTPEAGKIEVKAQYSDHDFTIVVKDSGIGIDAARLPFIFERFYQVEDSSSLKSYVRNYQGTGIGLALVKELVEVLKGQIQVESQIGIGTTFTVTLPTDKETWEGFISQKHTHNHNFETLQPTPVITNYTQTATNTIENNTDAELPILLIIEDNDDLRAYIRSHFEQTYQIIEAIDGQDGYKKTIMLIPDLVICDLMMPRLDGFGFCKMVKSDMRTNHIPVIMLTARATLEDRLEGLELGADDYLAKPFNTNELQLRVRNLINTQQALQAKYNRSIIKSLPNNGLKGTSLDEQFLQKLSDIIERNLQNTDFNTNLLADEMNMSAGQLRRKLKAITNQTIIEFIRHYKLQKAAILLQNKLVNVSEVAYQLGFESLSYFSRIFFEEFGKNPSEWSN